MNKEKLDAKRLKLLKTAFVKLREAANLIDKATISDAFKYDRPVLGIALCDTYGRTQIEVHLDGVEKLQQLAGSCETEEHSAEYASAFHESGALKLFTLEARPGKVYEDDDE